MSIRAKPLDELVWQDIVDLAASGIAEDVMLEFKGLLPEKNGKEHPWYRGGEDITTYTRDGLTAEVVALANAYGGRLFIGIAETQDRPRKAASVSPLPRCEKFVEQFQQALGAIVDPPLPGLQIRAVTNSSGEGEGAIVVAVPASNLAPHGIGRPPAAFVRRGTSCEAMTMRDLQSVFWETRTRTERINSARAEALADHASLLNNAVTVGLAVTMLALPHQDLAVPNLTASSHWAMNLCPYAEDLSSYRSGFAAGGRGSNQWWPRAHGIRTHGSVEGEWTIMQDGRVSASHLFAGHKQLGFDYVTSFAMLLIVTERLRRRAGRPDVPIEVSMHFGHDGSVEAETNGRVTAPLVPQFSIGPFLVEAQSSIPDVFREAETQICAGFSMEIPERLRAKIDFTKHFAEGPWQIG